MATRGDRAFVASKPHHPLQRATQRLPERLDPARGGLPAVGAQQLRQRAAANADLQDQIIGADGAALAAVERVVAGAEDHIAADCYRY